VQSYWLYGFGPDGVIERVTSLKCPDDEEAVREARRRAEPRPFELWSGRRLVERLMEPGRAYRAPFASPA
jgi:hypothetical protein